MDPVDIVYNQLNDYPDCQKESPERDEAGFWRILMLRKGDKCIKKLAGDIRNAAVCDGGYNAEDGHDAEFAFVGLHMSPDCSQSASSFVSGEFFFRFFLFHFGQE